MRASGREAGRARGGTGSPRGPFCVYAASKCSQVPFRVRGPAACGLVLCSGGPFPACGAFPRSGGAHALSAALYIDKGRCQNAICGRRWNAKREAAERRAS